MVMIMMMIMIMKMIKMIKLMVIMTMGHIILWLMMMVMIMKLMMMWFLSLSTFLVIERARTLASNSRRRCSATTNNNIGTVECRW